MNHLDICLNKAPGKVLGWLRESEGCIPAGQAAVAHPGQHCVAWWSPARPARLLLETAPGAAFSRPHGEKGGTKEVKKGMEIDLQVKLVE